MIPGPAIHAPVSEQLLRRVRWEEVEQDELFREERPESSDSKRNEEEFSLNDMMQSEGGNGCFAECVRGLG